MPFISNGAVEMLFKQMLGVEEGCVEVYRDQVRLGLLIAVRRNLYTHSIFISDEERINAQSGPELFKSYAMRLKYQMDNAERLATSDAASFLYALMLNISNKDANTVGFISLADDSLSINIPWAYFDQNTLTEMVENLKKTRLR